MSNLTSIIVLGGTKRSQTELKGKKIKRNKERENKAAQMIEHEQHIHNIAGRDPVLPPQEAGTAAMPCFHARN